MQKAVESRGRVWRGVSWQGVVWWRILAVPSFALFHGAAPMVQTPRPAGEGQGSQAASAAAASSGQDRGAYTLEQVFKGISSRDLKYRGAPLRLEYSRIANNAENQPSQKTDCTLLTYWNNSLEEIRNAKGWVGFQYRVGGVRAEVGWRWKGFGLLLPNNDADAEDQGERIFYHAHNYHEQHQDKARHRGRG